MLRETERRLSSYLCLIVPLPCVSYLALDVSFRFLAFLHFIRQAFHPDGDVRLKSGRVWIEPMAGNDVLLYQPNASAASDVFVSYDPEAKAWSIDGLADVDDYSILLQVGFEPASCNIVCGG